MYVFPATPLVKHWVIAHKVETSVPSKKGATSRDPSLRAERLD